MDIYKAILELKAERDRLDRAIAALEQKGKVDSTPRGRRAWNSEARRAAAERMKKYWEQRRRNTSANGASGGHNVSPPSTDSA